MYKYLERFAQLGGFIDKLSDGIHDKDDIKLEDPDSKPSNTGKSSANKQDTSNTEERKTVEQGKNILDEPLFIDPNNKDYLKRDPANLTDDEKAP